MSHLFVNLQIISLFMATGLAFGLSGTAGAGTGMVTVKGDRFDLDGKRWIPFGAFYRPASSMVDKGPERDWIANYDPEEIDRDLDLMHELGFSTIRIMTSVFYHIDHQNENWATYPTPETSYKARMDDLLKRLGKRGMKVQIFMHLYPSGSKWGMNIFDFVNDAEKRGQCLAMARKFINECNLSNRPEILAYELDWEPHVGNEALRNGTAYTDYYTPLRLWNRWIIDHYGSIEEAERCWGYIGDMRSAPEGELVTAPTDDQVFGDGPWTRKSVAYRRFIEELINKRYAYLREGIREVDKNHLLMAQRVCLLGKVPHNKNISYPVRHTSAFLDYYGYTYSPHETWSLFNLDTIRNDDDLFIRQGVGILFNKTNKPVIFDEYGSTTYLPTFPEYTTEQLEQRQVLLYRKFYETVERFGIDGMLAWWWIGRRPMYDNDSEESDWGILRHDHSRKPVFDEISAWSERIRSLPPYRPDSRIILDDFAHADENDTYIEGKQLVLDAVKAGKHPEVVTPYTDSDSGNCSLMCLCGLRSHKHCPKRALNAAFGPIEFNAGNGWKNIEYGEIIKVVSGRSIKFRLSVGNTAEALWLTQKSAGGRKGSVALVWNSGTASGEVPIASNVSRNTTVDLEFEIPAESIKDAEVRFTFSALERCEFGEIFKFKISQ